MLFLRPYKPADAEKIVLWVEDRLTYLRWGGDRIGPYPLTAEAMNEAYVEKNGFCLEADNFYPMCVVDEEGLCGQFIMRYVDGDRKKLRLGWVVVDPSKRGRGYGRQMLSLGLDFAFNLMKAELVTIGVFDCNKAAERCYRGLGFTDNQQMLGEVKTVDGETWRVVELKLERKVWLEK